RQAAPNRLAAPDPSFSGFLLVKGMVVLLPTPRSRAGAGGMTRLTRARNRHRAAARWAFGFPARVFVPRLERLAALTSKRNGHRVFLEAERFPHCKWPAT